MKTITVKNVKYSEFNSTDSLCFECTVYVDGKRFCIAHDEGFGGNVNFYPLKNSMAPNKHHEAVNALDTEIAETYPVHTYTHGGNEAHCYNESLEGLVTAAVGDYLMRRDFKREAKKIMWVENNSIFTSTKHKVTDTAMLPRYEKAYPDAIFFHKLTEDEGFDLYKKTANAMQ